MGSSARNNRLIDITKRLDEKREPRASDINLRNVITRNADGIIIVDRYGITRFANPAAESLFTTYLKDCSNVVNASFFSLKCD